MEEKVYSYLIENHIGKQNLIKNKELRKINKDIIISVDGGINNTNINKIKEAGAAICVVGSYITNNNIKEKIEELKK